MRCNENLQHNTKPFTLKQQPFISSQINLVIQEIDSKCQKKRSGFSSRSRRINETLRQIEGFKQKRESLEDSSSDTHQTKAINSFWFHPNQLSLNFFTLQICSTKGKHTNRGEVHLYLSIAYQKSNISYKLNITSEKHRVIYEVLCHKCKITVAKAEQMIT